MQQRWLFWLAPIAGAAIGGGPYPAVAGEPATEQTPADVQNRLAAVMQGGKGCGLQIVPCLRERGGRHHSHHLSDGAD